MRFGGKGRSVCVHFWAEEMEVCTISEVLRVLCIPGSRRRPVWLKCEVTGRVVHGGAGEVSRASTRPGVHCWVFITRLTQSITEVLVGQSHGLFSIFECLLWACCGREGEQKLGEPLELFCVCPEGWWQLVWREYRRTLASSL